MEDDSGLLNILSTGKVRLNVFVKTLPNYFSCTQSVNVAPGTSNFVTVTSKCLGRLALFGHSVHVLGYERHLCSAVSVLSE